MSGWGGVLATGAAALIGQATGNDALVAGAGAAAGVYKDGYEYLSKSLADEKRANRLAEASHERAKNLAKYNYDLQAEDREAKLGMEQEKINISRLGMEQQGAYQQGMLGNSALQLKQTGEYQQGMLAESKASREEQTERWDKQFAFNAQQSTIQQLERDQERSYREYRDVIGDARYMDNIKWERDGKNKVALQLAADMNTLEQQLKKENVEDLVTDLRAEGYSEHVVGLVKLQASGIDLGKIFTAIGTAGKSSGAVGSTKNPLSGDALGKIRQEALDQIMASDTYKVESKEDQDKAYIAANIRANNIMVTAYETMGLASSGGEGAPVSMFTPKDETAGSENVPIQDKAFDKAGYIQAQTAKIKAGILTVEDLQAETKDAPPEVKQAVTSIITATNTAETPDTALRKTPFMSKSWFKEREDYWKEHTQ